MQIRARFARTLRLKMTQRACSWAMDILLGDIQYNEVLHIGKTVTCTMYTFLNSKFLF
jgi:hypothetical protein